MFAQEDADIPSVVLVHFRYAGNGILETRVWGGKVFMLKDIGDDPVLFLPAYVIDVIKILIKGAAVYACRPRDLLYADLLYWGIFI